MTTLGDDGAIGSHVATGRAGALREHMQRLANDPRLDGRQSYPSREAAPQSCTTPAAPRRTATPETTPPIVDLGPAVDWGDVDDDAVAAEQADVEPEPEPEPEPIPEHPPEVTADDQAPIQEAGLLETPEAAGALPLADVLPGQPSTTLPPPIQPADALEEPTSAEPAGITVHRTVEDGIEVAVARLDLVAIAQLLAYALGEAIDVERDCVLVDGDAETGELLFGWSPRSTVDSGSGDAP